MDQPGYQPGVCNIGPAEIARRRRAGHLGLIAVLATLALLVAIGAPPVARLLVGLPAVVAATGYLQAWFRFCVAFGSAGVFNFGPTGSTETVPDPAARSRDRSTARRIGLMSLAIGLAVALAAAALPL